MTPGNFKIGGGFKFDKVKYYTGTVPEEFILSENDLIITMTDLSKEGDTLGYPALVPKANSTSRFLHNQRLGKVKIIDSKLDKLFLYYRLCCSDYRSHVLGGATGTTVKHTSPTRILQFKLIVPDLSTQKLIGEILGSIDEKIAINRHMNQILEEMVSVIFKSWFIDFDPVSAKMEERDTGLPFEIAELFPNTFDLSSLGKIPKGWKVEKFGNAFEINPTRYLKKGFLAPFLDMQNMPTSGYRPLDWTSRIFGSGMRFKNGDTLMARITPCLENGKTAFVDFLAEGEVAWGSTEYIVIRAKPPLPNEFSYFFARDDSFRAFAIKSMTGTSGRQRVQNASLQNYDVVIPPESICNVFGRIAHDFFNAAKKNSEQTKTLASLRDMLLPKLINGELNLQGG